MCCVKLLFFFGYMNKKKGARFVKINENDEKVVKDKRLILKRNHRNAIILIRMGGVYLGVCGHIIKKEISV